MAKIRVRGSRGGIYYSMTKSCCKVLLVMGTTSGHDQVTSGSACDRTPSIDTLSQGI